VGTYPQGGGFGFGELSSAAVSAAEFALWLVGEMNYPHRPLKYLDLCIAPASTLDPAIQADYLARLQAVGDTLLQAADPRWNYQPCDYDSLRVALLAWKTACTQAADDVAMFFYVGHGIQPTDKIVVLVPQDFDGNSPDPDFGSCIDIYKLREATATFKTRDKFYFIDACRSQSSKLVNKDVSGNSVLMASTNKSHQGAAPIYFSTKQDKVAWGRDNKTSLFTESLLRAFRGAGAVRGLDQYQGSWVVELMSLKSGVQTVIKHHVELGLAYEQDDMMDAVGAMKGPLHIVDPDKNPQIPMMIRWPGVPYQLSVTLPGKAPQNAVATPFHDLALALPPPLSFDMAKFEVQSNGLAVKVNLLQWPIYPPRLECNLTII